MPQVFALLALHPLGTLRRSPNVIGCRAAARFLATHLQTVYGVARLTVRPSSIEGA